MARDAGASLIVTAADLTASGAFRDLSYPINEPEASTASIVANVDRAPIGASISDLAYVIYTSGTTGRPKGVLTTHRNLTNFLVGMLTCLGFSETDTCLAITSISFDPHTLEILLPLIVGAKIVLVRDRDTKTPDRLAGLIERHRVSIMQGTPSTWRMMLNDNWKPRGPLTALCGGEAMSPMLRDALLKLPRLVLWNVYGPTETTVWCSAMKISPEAEICIGPPIHNTQFYVLDEAMNEVPVGGVGELYIGGAGLARGYVSQPHLTNETFIANPFSSRPSDLFYRSGDIVRRLDNGCLKYLNRADHQVKIRGYRVELLEVEAAIGDCPNVSDAAVVADGASRLIAFIVPADRLTDPTDLSERIVRRIAQRLPSFMIPSIFHAVDRVPLTLNGKVDRSALLDRHRASRPSPRSEPAYKGTARQLYAIWANILEHDAIGPNDRYADVGGDSLNVVTLRLRILENWQVNPSIEELKNNDTIASMSSLIERLPKMPSPTPRVFSERTRRLSPSQEVLVTETRADRLAWNSLEFLLAAKRTKALVSNAIAALLCRHDVFSINWVGLMDGTLHQRFSKAVAGKIIDATPFHPTVSEFVGELASYRNFISPRDGRLFSWVILEVEDTVYIYFVAHHLIMDEISIGYLKDELNLLLENSNVKLPNAISFGEWLDYYFGALQGGRFDRELEYWRDVVKLRPQPSRSTPTALTAGSLVVQRRRYDKQDLGFTTNRGHRAHDVLFASCALMLARILSSTKILCRLVVSGRGIFEDVDDSFTVGWLAHHCPVAVSICPTATETYKHLVGQLSYIPHQGAGFGWLRYGTRPEPLLDATQLTEFPMYFNFLPRHQASSLSFSDESHLLPAIPESRSSMRGIGFGAEEFADHFVVAAAYDGAAILDATVTRGLDEIANTFKMICMES